MQMRTGRIAGIADVADQLALTNILTDVNNKPAHVRIQRVMDARVIDLDVIASAVLLLCNSLQAGLRIRGV